MGLGYGSYHMRNTDGMMCRFTWTNSTTDQITCLDVWFSETHSVIFGPETPDVRTIRTLQANVTTGTFAVHFQRPFIGSDVTRDTNLTLSTPNWILWSHSIIANGIPLKHAASDRNYFKLTLATGEIEGLPSSGFQGLATSLMAIFALLGMMII